MIINDSEFPNQMFDALKEGKLVVFAGAGASRMSPTNLPNFKDLTKKLSDGTGRMIGKKEPCEVFLGTFKSGEINVNSEAAAIFSDVSLKYNKIHESIVNLFLSPSDIRIVTTNYDKMFEAVLDEKGLAYKAYCSPALPLGDDFSGIIHLHGSVDNPQYMVLTDDDFGRAYLTDGYAARFLIKLFDSYTILFIGYSYDDTILRYLTRAMSKKLSQNRYILTDNKKVQWQNLGIHPIFFPKQKYTFIPDSLEIIGIRAKRNLSEWKEVFALTADQPLKGISFESELEYCLGKNERTQIIANIVYGKQWFLKLKEKGVFNNLLRDDVVLSQNDIIWADWICAKVIGAEDEFLLRFLKSSDTSIHPYFAEKVLKKIQEESVSNENFQKYIILLETYIFEKYLLWRLTENAKKRELTQLCQMLYTKLWYVRFMVESRPFDLNVDYRHYFLGDAHIASLLWNSCGFGTNILLAKDFLRFFETKLLEIHNKYCELGLADENKEPWRLSFLEIEEPIKAHFDDELTCLIHQMTEISLLIESDSPEYLKQILVNGLRSKSVLAKRVFLKIIRETNVFSSDESVSLLFSQNLLEDHSYKEQVFLLVKKIFPSMSIENINKLIDIIESIGTPEAEYEVYNWCIWLHGICPENERINGILKDILARRSYKPREFPEKDFYFSSEDLASKEKPIKKNELLQLESKEVLTYLQSIQSQYGPDIGFSMDFVNEFSEAISSDFAWSMGILTELKKNNLEDKFVLEGYLDGVLKSDYSQEDSIKLIDEWMESSKCIRIPHKIIRFIWKTVQKYDFRDDLVIGKKVWKAIIDCWEEVRSNEVLEKDYPSLFYSSSSGALLMSAVTLYSRRQAGFSEDEFFLFFNSALAQKGKQRELAIFILAGHYEFFFKNDKEWSKCNLELFLKGQSRSSYCAAWSGLVFFNNYINLDFADNMSVIFLAAVQKIDWLNRKTRDGFIELFLSLLLYVVYDPISKYIPSFYTNANSRDREFFCEAISRRLIAMGDDAQVMWWNHWLKRFVENLMKNKPVKPSDAELKAIIGWIPNTDSIFGELIKLVQAGKVPKKIDEMLFFEIIENELHIKYPAETYVLLSHLLDSEVSLSFGISEIKEIVISIRDYLSDEENGILNEALLKKNIQFSE